MRRIPSLLLLLLLPALLAGPAVAQEHDPSTDLLKKAVALSLKSSELAAQGKEKEAQALAGKAATLLKAYSQEQSGLAKQAEYAAQAEKAKQEKRTAELAAQLTDFVVAAHVAEEARKASLAIPLRHDPTCKKGEKAGTRYRLRFGGTDAGIEGELLEGLQVLGFMDESETQDPFALSEGLDRLGVDFRALVGGDDGDPFVWSESLGGEGLQFVLPEMDGEWRAALGGIELELIEGEDHAIVLGSGGQQIYLYLSPEISEGGLLELKVQTGAEAPHASRQQKVVVVRPGDTLDRISRRELGSDDRVLDVRPTISHDRRYIALELRLPVPPDPPGPAAPPVPPGPPVGPHAPHAPHATVPHAEAPQAVPVDEARALIQEMRTELEALRAELKALRASARSVERFR